MITTATKRAAAACALLASTALTAAAAFAADYVPPKVDTRTPTGVNLADGSLVLTQTDLSIGSLTLERVHQGGHKDPNDPFFGPRMTHNFDIYVAKNKASAVYPVLPDRYKPVVHLGGGAAGPYVHDLVANPKVYPSSDDAASGSLALVNGAYVYTAQDGTIYSFNPSVPAAGALGGSGSQRVARIDFPNGRTLTFSYNGSGQLKLVSDNMGYGLVFDYNASGTVSAACGYSLGAAYLSASSTCANAALKTAYRYAGGVLTSVTDVGGQITTYGYSGNRITCVQPPGYTSCKIANSYANVTAGTTYQVTQQTLADGGVWRFSYWGDYGIARDPELYGGSEPTAGTAVTDPAGKKSSYSFVKTSPYDFTDANSRSTSYRYTGGYDYESSAYPNPRPELNEGAMLVEVGLPEGNKYLAEYNGPYYLISKETWTAKPGSGVPDAVLETGYNCPVGASRISCTRPIWKKDAKGNQTDFSYTGFGSIQSEMQPAPTPGAARPLKLYGYVQKYASVRDGSGGIVPASAPVWMLSTETQCQTSPGGNAPVCDGNARQTVTTYEYGADGTADNLLVRGKVVTADGRSLRACFRYDRQGNRIAETGPRAGLTSCS